MTINGAPMPPDPGCFWHGDEPIPPDAFRVCVECGHCWPTRGEFVADVHAHHAEVALALGTSGQPPPDDIPFCPLCAHDF